MIPVRNAPNGPMWLQGYADFTNHLMKWRNEHNENNPDDFICIWHPRGKKGPVDDDEDAESSQQRPRRTFFQFSSHSQLLLYTSMQPQYTFTHSPTTSSIKSNQTQHASESKPPREPHHRANGSSTPGTQTQIEAYANPPPQTKIPHSCQRLLCLSTKRFQDSH